MILLMCDGMHDIKESELVKISFDGFGYHDWMRNHKGAEQATLRSIKLCKKNGFSVMVPMNINRKNCESVLESLEYLDNVGVDRTRIICTTESTRWAQNAAGQSFTVPEYYDTCIEVARGYIGKAHMMSLVFWQFMDTGNHSRSVKVPEEILRKIFRFLYGLC